jgi:hypothetical protein
MDPAALGLDRLDPWEAAGRSMPEVRDKLFDSDWRGTLLVGPATVDTKARETLPLLGFHSFDTPEPEGEVFDPFAVVSASCLETGEVLATTVAMLRDEEPATGGPPKAPSTVVKQFHFDLRDRLPELAWARGTWLVTIHLAERTSNRIVVRLEAEDDPPAPPARKVTPPPGGPGELPSYKVDPFSVPAPAGVGIVLQGPDERAPSTLKGGLRLPVGANDVARPGCGDPSAVAVLPVTLLFTGRHEAGAWAVPLGVPSYEPLATPGALTEAAFALDLTRTAGVPGVPQGYTLWALSGDVLSRPLVLTPR